MRRLDVTGIAPYLVILLISSCLYYQALQISPGGEGHLGADFWPKTILVFAIFTCAWEITRKIWVGTPPGDRLSPTDISSGDTSLIPQRMPLEDAPEVGRFVPWMGIGLTAAYVFSFPWLGYFLATLLYVTAFVFLGNYRRSLVAICVGITASLAFMFLFMRVVYVSLPIGVEPFAQLSTLLMRAMGIK
jgi:putative tricarboxylic transport membrane protein